MTYEEKLQIFDTASDMVYDIVNKHWGKHYIEFDDLVQEGMLMLWKAIDTFDANKQCTLSTYIYASVSTHLSTYVHTYRYGQVAYSKTFRDAMKIVRYAKQNEMPIDTACNEKNATKMTRKYAHMLFEGENFFASLSTKRYIKEDDNYDTLLDQIPCDTNFTNDICERLDSERLTDILYNDFVETVMQHYQGSNKIRYRKVVIAFLNSILVQPRTQVDIARELNISHQAVQQYFVKIRKELKKFLTKKQCVSIPAH